MLCPVTERTCLQSEAVDETVTELYTIRLIRQKKKKYTVKNLCGAKFKFNLILNLIFNRFLLGQENRK